MNMRFIQVGEIGPDFIEEEPVTVRAMEEVAGHLTAPRAQRQPLSRHMKSFEFLRSGNCQRSASPSSGMNM